MTSQVYVMQSELGLVKIGRSRQPEKRLKKVSSMSGVVVRLHHAIEHSDAPAVETAAHQLLQQKRLAGEWFDVTPAEAVAAIEAAIKMIDAKPKPSPCAGCKPLPIVVVVPTAFQRPSTLDEAGLLALFEKSVEELGGPQAWADRAMVSIQYVSDVLRRRRGPGRGIYKALGYEKRVTYYEG